MTPSEDAGGVGPPGPVGQTGEAVSPVDHAWLRTDEPAIVMMGNGVLACDEPLGRDELVGIMEELMRAAGYRGLARTHPT